MKTAKNRLGYAIQLFLFQQGASLEQLAAEMGMNPDSLSNLIHGRRNFRNTVLERMANTPTFQAGDFSLRRLLALRSLDEYDFETLILAVLEAIRQGQVESLAPDWHEKLATELEKGDLTEGLQQRSRALLELVR